MNLELNGHRITLGPKALAFIETNMRGMGEVYCRDQLELWRAGGKCDPDVTVIGPARFVAKGNAIGIPMMPKAGVAPASVAECKTGSKEPLPVASAAPAGEWPKWLRYRTFLVLCADATDNGTAYAQYGRTWREHRTYSDRKEYKAIITPTEAAKWLRTHGHAKVADELERSTTQAQGVI